MRVSFRRKKHTKYFIFLQTWEWGEETIRKNQAINFNKWEKKWRQERLKKSTSWQSSVAWPHFLGWLLPRHMVEQEESTSTNNGFFVNGSPTAISQIHFIMISLCCHNSWKKKKINSTILSFSKMAGLRRVKQWFKLMAEVGLWVRS